MTTDEKIKAATAVVALAGLLWTAFSFLQLRAVEAAKPYLEKKLAWCEEAVETAARIAHANVASQVDVDDFFQMYIGVMGMIEKTKIEQAMVAFGAEMTKPQTPAEGTNGEAIPLTKLQERSLALAHACRHELSLEWSPSWARD